MLLYSTLWYSTLLYFMLLYSTLFYSTLLYATLLYSSLPFPELQLYCTVLRSTLLYSSLCHAMLKPANNSRSSDKCPVNFSFWLAKAFPGRTLWPCMSVAQISWEYGKILFNREVKHDVYSKRQKWNLCRPSSTLCTVESKYLYLLWIVRDTFLYLCDLSKDYKKRIEIRGNLCRLPSAVNVMLNFSIIQFTILRKKWKNAVLCFVSTVSCIYPKAAV